MSTIPLFTNNEPEIASHVTSARAESTSRRYFAIGLAFCCLFYLFPFFAFRSGIKPEWWTSYWSHVVETMYHQQRQDADVIIFGDSTAATNTDPVRMTKDLNLKVIVMPNVATSLPVTGYDPLEGYLQTNKQPRLIAFYLSPWDLDFMHSSFTPIVEEGVEMLLLHESWSSILHYASHHPLKMLMFPLHFYAATNRIGDIVYFRDHDVATVKQGHILNLPHPTPMKPDCILDKKLFAKGFGDTTAREAVSRFTRPGTQTMVVIAPAPNCKNVDVLKNVQHPGLEIPPLQVLPPEDFREDGWQAHMLPGKIGPSTDYLEAAIRQKLQPITPGAKREQIDLLPR